MDTPVLEGLLALKVRKDFSVIQVHKALQVLEASPDQLRLLQDHREHRAHKVSLARRAQPDQQDHKDLKV